jgi:alpha-tubulin suppressor-like RCC1 family protein
MVGRSRSRARIGVWASVAAVLIGIAAWSAPASGLSSAPPARLPTVHRPAQNTSPTSAAAAGSVRAWGADAVGQLGDATGNALGDPQPQAVQGLTGVTAISASSAGTHTLALLNDGTVSAWGANAHGQLGNGKTTISEAPVRVPALSGVIAVAAGSSHSLALLTNGTVKAWGDNSRGELGNNTTRDSHVPITVSGLAGVVSISAGDRSSYAVLKNGTVKAWGFNANGQLGDDTTLDRHAPVVVSGLTTVASISAGDQFTLALLKNGTVKAWGSNRNGQLGIGTTSDSHVPIATTGLSAITMVAAGKSHSLALLRNGTVKAWGTNAFGQLGNKSTRASRVPVTVSGLSGVQTIAAGSNFSLAVTSSGTLDAWGFDGDGELATGSYNSGCPGASCTGYATQNSDVPVAAATSQLMTIAAGSSYGVGIMKNYVGAPQPTMPIRATNFYAWYPAGFDQGATFPYSHYVPTSGFYRSMDPQVMNRQIDDMIYAGLNAALFSWWGQAAQKSVFNQEDSRFQSYLDATGDRPLKWAVYYECVNLNGSGGSCKDASQVGQIASDLAYIKKKYASNPNYLRIDGKPVIFFYNDGKDLSCATVANVYMANQNTGFWTDLLTRAEFPGYQSCPDQPDAWHEYLVGIPEDQIPGFFHINPAFVPAYNYPVNRELPRDLTRFEQNVQDMIASNEPIQLVSTYNEWIEGTAVESASGSNGWASADGHGQYIDALHQALVGP